MPRIQYDLSTVQNVQFGVLSDEQIQRMSVLEITDSTIYDGAQQPKLNGLADPRMGVTERGKRCKTCEQDYITCPGHIGHISLARPLFNFQFEKEIIKIVRCICIKCSKLLINKEHPVVKNILFATKGNNKNRFDQIFKLITANIKPGKELRCGISEEDRRNTNAHLLDNGGCGAIQPTTIKNKIRDEVALEVEWKGVEGKGSAVATQSIIQKMHCELVLEIFRRISPEDNAILGFGHDWCLPHYLIFQSLPVTPPCSRPSVRQDNGNRSEDDITHKYIDIIKHNISLRSLIATQGIDAITVLRQTSTLLWHVITLIDNEDKNIGIQALTRNGRPIKSITERLKGKEGRFRGNLMGKRVDFSARSVISPDANLKVSELGVPKMMAKNLTFPEVVNKYNIDKLYKLIKNGNNIYPGAKSIEQKKTGMLRLLIDSNLDEIVLEYGDKVNRHLQNGDYVLFNRQPTLHRMSMMAHKIRVMPGKTFRLNTDVCEPYNADFDGDEMNMHVPQSFQTLMELKYLAAVPHHFISPSSNEPIIKPSQDNLLGLFKLTGDDILLSQVEAQHLLSGTETFDGLLPDPIVKDGKYIRWSGKQIYSAILPPISLSANPKSENVAKVIIINGTITSGQVDKSVSNMIIHAIHSEFGSIATERYMNDLQMVISRYLIKSGFSVGVSDLVIHPDIIKKNRELILETRLKEVELTKKIHLNILEDVAGDLSTVYEAEVNKLATDLEKKLTKQTTDTLSIHDNRVYFMIASGAKGKDINIKQMMVSLGQQTIDDGRVPINFTDRTLPHYPRYENGMESRGFISDNYREGLHPIPFYFHAMSGRVGLIDTAVKTATSGYLQRKLIKSMEDLKTYDDLTIRDSTGDIVEFLYGGDGFDSSRLESYKLSKLPLRLITQDKLYEKYLFNKNEDMNTYMLKSAIKQMETKYPDWRKQLDSYNMDVQRIMDAMHTLYTKYYSNLEEYVFYPVNILKLLQKTVNLFNLDKINTKSSLNPVIIYKQLRKLIDKECVVKNIKNITFEILIFNYLSPKQLIKEYKFNHKALEYLLAQIRVGFSNGLIVAGEMVGPVAAQSIGERSTQLTLNTFHLSGVGSAGKVTQGVPRLTELLTITKDPKTPSNILYLYDNARFDRDRAEQVKNNIEQTKIDDILAGDPVFYLEPYGKSINKTVLEEDQDFMKFYDIFTELDKTNIKDAANKNPWLIRLEFNRKEMLHRNVSMSDVHQVLALVYQDASLMYSDDNSHKLIFRIRIPFERKDTVEDDYKELQIRAADIRDVIIKGVDNINKVFVSANNEINDFVVAGKNTRGFSKLGEVYESKPEYRLTTEGANLFDLLIRDDIDDTRCYSSDPNEMNMIFGIEAGKYTIEHEFHAIMKEGRTNPRHISLLVNKITHNGSFMSVHSHGINKEDIGPLAKCCFEETDRQLRMASIFGDIDPLRSVSANIVMGQIPDCGTGAIKLYLDEAAMEEGMAEMGINKPLERDTTKDINEHDVMNQLKHKICVSEDDQILIGHIESDGLALSQIPGVSVE